MTCDDNGTYTLTFTANDGVNPPVSASETLTVLNVDPTPTLTLSPGPHAVGSTVTADVSIVDPGTLDTEDVLDRLGRRHAERRVRRRRGVTAARRIRTRRAGSYTVTATVADKDGGTGTDSKTPS